MKRLLKFLRLTPLERGLLLRAVVLLWAVRLGLWILPFHRLREFLVRRARPRNSTGLGHRDLASPDQIVRAIIMAGRYVPRASCLTQALAAQVLLGRRGFISQLHIGVHKGAGQRFQAHAWLQYQEKVVIGAADKDRFTPLTSTE
jgi:hypothetical protein